MMPLGQVYRQWLALAAIVVAMALTYRGVVHNGFVLDDFHTVVTNRSLDSFAGARQWFLSAEGVSGQTAVRGYRPVVMASYALDRAIWGEGPAGYHIGSLVVHAAVVALTFVLATRLWSDAMAGLVAALFVALHPLNAQAVNYIAARSSSLMTLWILLSVWCYDRASADLSVRRRTWAGQAWTAGALVAAALALGTKEAAIVLPLLIIAWDRARADGRGWNVTARRAVPFVALAAGLLAVREIVLGGMTGAALTRDAADVFWIAVKLVVFSLTHWVWPTGLAIDYAWPMSMSSVERVGWLLAAAGAVAGTGALLRYRHQVGWCLVWFWVSLLPILALPFITKLLLYQEHRSYLGGIALGWVAGGMALMLWRAFPRSRGVLASVLVGLTAAAAWADVGRTVAWRDVISVWEDSLAKYPNSTLGHNAKATWLAEAGRLEEARVELERSLAIDPSRGRTHSLLGVLYALMGEHERAVAQFNVALAIDPSDPDARMNLGKAYEQTQRPEQALVVYEQLVRNYPGHAPAWGRAGVILEQLGRTAEAAERYRQVVALDPTDDTAWEALGGVLLQLGEWREAERVFMRLVTRHPDSGASWFNLGVARERLEHEAAADAFQRAAALAPGDPDPDFRIGMIHVRRGAWESAAEAFERAIAREPSHALSHLNLALVSERRGDVIRAVGHYQEVLDVADRLEHESLRSRAEEGLARLGRSRPAGASHKRPTIGGASR